MIGILILNFIKEESYEKHPAAFVDMENLSKSIGLQFKYRTNYPTSIIFLIITTYEVQEDSSTASL